MAIFFQIAWALLCTGWNAYGLYLVQQGARPIGPTASAVVAGLCVVLALLFGLFHSKRLKWPYIILSALTALMAAYAVYGGFVQDPALWPSESWRWAGIVLNGVGTAAGIAAITKAINWKSNNS